MFHGFYNEFIIDDKFRRRSKLNPPPPNYNFDDKMKSIKYKEFLFNTNNIANNAILLDKIDDNLI
jgi:hypothetical protein